MLKHVLMCLFLKYLIQKLQLSNIMRILSLLVRSSTYCLTLILQKMTEIDYKNLAEYQRYENLVNTKDASSEDEVFDLI